MQPEQDIEAFRREVERLTDLLEESQIAQRESADHAEELGRAAAYDSAEVERLRNEMKLFKEDASRFSREDDRRIRRLEREKQEADRKIKRLKTEVGELRSVIKQYVGEIQNGMADESRSALHSELDLVRERAENDLNRMREQLEANHLNGGTDAAELDHLRKDLETLRHDASMQSESLERASAEQASLRVEIEERCDEIRRLQRALESAQEENASVEEGRREHLDARKLAERNLVDAQQEIDRLRRRAAKDAAKGSAAAPQAAGGGAWGSLLVALVAFLVADGIAVSTGKGELISGLLSGPVTPSTYTVKPVEGSAGVDPQAGIVKARPIASPDMQAPSAPMVTTERDGRGIAAGEEASPKSLAGATLRDRLRSGGQGPLMAYIAGGDFAMGQQRDSLQMDEQPVREVSLEGFAIGKYEVTFEEYQAFAIATGRKIPGDNGWGRGRRPVINVSWNDAQAYTRWLSRQTGAHYRLPTEAEWEFAAKAGSDSFFWWGYELGENQASCFDCGSRWDAKSTAPVGSFAANAYSLNDTAGNVMEWVEDCYRNSYRGAPVDGSAFSQPGCGEQVARGGAYNKPGESLHSTRRFHFHSDTRLPTLGFRVARDGRRGSWISN